MSETTQSSSRNPWLWIPSLYFAEGLPYVIVMTVSVIMYKTLGVSNTEIALYTSWLYLPWVIKPLWSPLVEVLKTKRWWIVVMQLLIGAGLAGIAFTIPTSSFLQYTLAFLWLMAFSSATHDIAADGFYMLPMSTHEQAWFVGIRSTFYRLAMIAGQGLLVMLAGALEVHYGLPEVTFQVEAVMEQSEDSSFEPVAISRVLEDEQHILVSEGMYRVGLQGRSPEYVNDLIREVRDWNLKHAFYGEEKKALKAEQQKPVWLQKLEAFIVEWFGEKSEKKEVTQIAGDIAIVQLFLNQPLEGDESRVVNLSFSGGDKNLKIVEGTRFRIDASNSDQPFVAVVQVDSRLDAPSEAKFRAVSGDSKIAWKITFLILAGFFLVICLYHAFALPRPSGDVAKESKDLASLVQDFLVPFQSFFLKKGVVVSLLFLLLYRFSEAQLVKLASPFLLDEPEVGGLALSTGAVGFVYGTVGIVMLTLGGIFGGLLAAKQGLKFWLPWMVLAMNLPNAAYLFLSQTQTESYFLVNLAVAVEQFGYGFGFTAYMLYMLYFSQGKHETAHYAICTGFMALGMMLPGMTSGWLQDLIGYQHFFIWVLIATIPSFLVCWLVDIDEDFGKEEKPHDSEHNDG